MKVTDDNFVVVGAGEKVVGSGGEAHRADVTAVRAVRLNYAAPFDVVQHAGAVLLTRGEQAAAGIHRHRSDRTSCVRQTGKVSSVCCGFKHDRTADLFLSYCVFWGAKKMWVNCVGVLTPRSAHPSRQGSAPLLGVMWELT